MEYRLIEPEEYKTMPWKNGKGMTRELFVKNDPDSDRYIYRLSAAGVIEDGEFSDFQGYDRTLIMLEGSGITLYHSDGTVNELRTASDVAKFSGDLKTRANLINGPVKDFNIMTLRGKCRSDAEVIISSGRLSAVSDELLVYALSDSVLVHKSGSIKVRKDHLLYFCEPAPEYILIEGSIILIKIAMI